MSAIRIDTLPVLSDLQDRDLVNFQRLVDGVWTDYHTDGATLQGAIRMFIQPIDMSDSSGVTIYTPGLDEIVVPLAMWMTATPGEPSGLSPVVLSVQFFNSGGGGNALDISVNIGTDPVVYNAIDISEFNALDTSLELIWTSTNATGNAVIFCQYAVLPKV